MTNQSADNPPPQPASADGGKDIVEELQGWQAVADSFGAADTLLARAAAEILRLRSAPPVTDPHLPAHVVKALRHARIDIDSCIKTIEQGGNGDTCEGLRQTLDLIDAALTPATKADQ